MKRSCVAGITMLALLPSPAFALPFDAAQRGHYAFGVLVAIIVVVLAWWRYTRGDSGAAIVVWCALLGGGLLLLRYKPAGVAEFVRGLT